MMIVGWTNFRDLQITVIKEVFCPSDERKTVWMAAYIISQESKRNIYSDNRGTNLDVLLVEEVNQLAANGMPFRDAYTRRWVLILSRQKFRAGTRIIHWSIRMEVSGNLCNDKISDAVVFLGWIAISERLENGSRKTLWNMRRKRMLQAYHLWWHDYPLSGNVDMWITVPSIVVTCSFYTIPPLSHIISATNPLAISVSLWKPVRNVFLDTPPTLMCRLRTERDEDTSLTAQIRKNYPLYKRYLSGSHQTVLHLPRLQVYARTHASTDHVPNRLAQQFTWAFYPLFSGKRSGGNGVSEMWRGTWRNATTGVVA